MQGARQQAEREQERYDEWKRQTDEQRADRERLQQQWDDWAKSQPGLMQTASQDGQPVTAAGGIGPGLMNGVVPVAGHGG